MEESWHKAKITPQIAGVYPGPPPQVNQPGAKAAEIRELKLALEKERKEHQETRSKLKSSEEELQSAWSQLHAAFRDNLKFLRIDNFKKVDELELEKGAELLRLELEEANRKYQNMKEFLEGKLDEKDREIWEKEKMLKESIENENRLREQHDATVTEMKMKIQKLEEKMDGAKKNALAQTVPPGDIETQPATKIVFKGPYADQITYHQCIKVINSSARRIAYCIKTTKRLRVNVPCGVLEPKEGANLIVSFKKLFGRVDDHITVEWINTPDGAGEFRREWFQGDSMVRKKNLPIEYNPFSE
ncbi:hypothetical protein GCK72_015881 [Caenorhabditis remanei]|uniref:Major sperm protein n=1 Tax=Caenorhabditis remanei TaxID=31234 RepID=A0A6A5GXU5_CAERE|nr:hypothetical protein GCK72_015881 [Caenorhabditis remanei]KAF1759414.1 hypothetical protein GCK72_015881 [Caenorhabditis remanei]